MSLYARNHVKGEVHGFVNPYAELNAGLWSLFAGATVLLALRLWIKVTRRHGLWYDDHILVTSWVILLANNSLIVHEFATGLVPKDSAQKWDDRMQILINISTCGNLIGQSLTKTAFGVTLLRMTKDWLRWAIWFCIGTMNLWMLLRMLFQWAKVCDNTSYQNHYRLNFCISDQFRKDFKEGGNVYNIIMDFIFAFIPWLVLKPLGLKKMEKIGLGLTMSLGMIVAIVAAVRVSWKNDENGRDEWFFWRNGVAQVWYNSEITGTIIVQCIPVLRSLAKDIHTSLVAKRLSSTTAGGRDSFRDSRSRKKISGGAHPEGGWRSIDDKAGQATTVQRGLSVETSQDAQLPLSLLSPSFSVNYTTQASPRSESWILSPSESRFRRSRDRDTWSTMACDIERDGPFFGLSPPPPPPPPKD
ncbi:uncharacterized protein E0L32_009411 [Thyridium curvatum]|uniref:Rhodopsin domain-containing protein n=1 Tax=Thyridium curvatum TaxID=1093900 RepID=A0A507APP3_9PEZI|nr:uncharacterized protein E0L32_009411 [Thyridium curvatum]TPX09367.1 hypothetical protein E0L32_009411 [Thyridium curvatum]